MSKAFNDQFRRALRNEPEPEPVEQPDSQPKPTGSVDGGAGTGGQRPNVAPPSMNDFIRKAARDRD